MATADLDGAMGGILSAARPLVQAYGDQRAADQSTIDQATIADVQSQLVSVQGQLASMTTQDQADQAALQAANTQIAALQAQLGMICPVPGFNTLAWQETFADLSHWTVQDGTTRSNEQSVSSKDNVGVQSGVLVGHGARLTTPVKGMNYSSFYVDSIAHSERQVKPGSFICWDTQLGVKEGVSAGIWWGSVWFRANQGSQELDGPETWGNPNSQTGTANDMRGRYSLSYFPNTNSSSVRYGGFSGAIDSLDLGSWFTPGWLIEADCSITPYLNGKPLAPVGGAWPANTPRLSAAKYTTLKLAAGDAYNIRMNLQVTKAGSYYGAPNDQTDFSQTMKVRNMRVWTP